jgi:tetratricopeptide (TPR) repeat protein
MRGDTAVAGRDGAEAVELLRSLGDSWAVVHAEALLANVAQAEGRLADAAPALERAADESGRLGFLGQAALHRATLGRVQHRLGDDRALSSYERAVADALAVGDGRLAATARLNLARWLRGHGEGDRAIALLEENLRWYRSAGGGDFALLTACVHASMRNDAVAVSEVLQRARDEGNHEVELHALDAQARLLAERGDPEQAAVLLAEADALAPHLAHVVDPADRIDAGGARRAI